MLIALMTILFLGGGGSSAVMTYIAEYTDTIKEILEDDDRRDTALETMAAFKNLGKQQSKARADVVKQMEKALKDTDRSPEAVNELWSDYYQQVRDINDAAVDHRFELREQLTREEWEQVFNPSAGKAGS
jgi:hypothetical protein